MWGSLRLAKTIMLYHSCSQHVCHVVLCVSSTILYYWFFFGASLSKPHIDHDNGPHAWNSAIYLYHLPCVCRTLVPKIHICPEMLRVFWYIDMLTCMIYNCTKQG